MHNLIREMPSQTGDNEGGFTRSHVGPMDYEASDTDWLTTSHKQSSLNTQTGQQRANSLGGTASNAPQQQQAQRNLTKANSSSPFKLAQHIFDGTDGGNGNNNSNVQNENSYPNTPVVGDRMASGFPQHGQQMPGSASPMRSIPMDGVHSSPMGIGSATGGTIRRRFNHTPSGRYSLGSRRATPPKMNQQIVGTASGFSSAKGGASPRANNNGALVGGGHAASNSSGSSISFHLYWPFIIMGYVQLAFNTAVVLALSYLAFSFYMTIRDDVHIKVSERMASLLAEIALCTRQYNENKCNNRVPAIEAACSAWEACMTRNPSVISRAKLTAETFAEIINGFIEPVSYKTMIFMLVALFGTVFLSNYAFTVARGRVMPQHQTGSTSSRRMAPHDDGDDGDGTGGGGNNDRLSIQKYAHRSVHSTPKDASPFIEVLDIDDHREHRSTVPQRSLVPVY